MNTNFRFLLFVVLFFTVLNSTGQDISQWRGPNRDGIYPDKDLLNVWPEAGPKLLWLTEVLGNGYSSPVIADGKLYINGEIDSISHVFAFDQNGKLLWKTPNGREFFGEGYSASFSRSKVGSNGL